MAIYFFSKYLSLIQNKNISAYAILSWSINQLNTRYKKNIKA